MVRVRALTLSLSEALARVTPDELWRDVRERQLRLVKTLIEGALAEEMTVLLDATRYRRTETRQG